MRSMLRGGLGLAVSVLCACGSTEARPPQQPTTPVASSAERSSASAPPSVLQFIDPNSPLVAYVNANALRSSAGYRALLDLVQSEPGARAYWAELTQRCEFNPLEAPRELAFSLSMLDGEADGNSAFLVASSNFALDATMECLQRVAPDFSRTLVVKEPFLVSGPPDAVQSAVARLVASTSPPPSDDLIRLEYQGDNPLGAKQVVVRIRNHDGLSEIRVEAVGTDAAHAQRMEQQMREQLNAERSEIADASAPTVGQLMTAKLLAAFVIERGGNRVSAKLVSNQGEEEAGTFGMLASLSIAGVRRYVMQAKLSEMRLGVRRIADGLGSYAERQKKRRFPSSGARVPTRVPSGAKYQSAPAEWQAAGWHDIGFSLSEPQFYAYEFETAPNGQRATVRALGDLDGDGVQSRFELDVSIEQGQIVIGEMREQDAKE